MSKLTEATFVEALGYNTKGPSFIDLMLERFKELDLDEESLLFYNHAMLQLDCMDVPAGLSTLLLLAVVDGALVQQTLHERIVELEGLLSGLRTADGARDA